MVDLSPHRRCARPRRRSAPLTPAISCELAMVGDAYLPAVLQHRADRTFRQTARANVLSERHQQAIYLDPVFSGQPLLESETGSFRGLSPHESPAVGHPMNVHIDADLGRSAGNSQREVRAFRTHAAE